MAAEFPSEALAREVLGKIGSGEAKYTRIARAAGGINFQPRLLKRLVIAWPTLI